MERGGTAHSKGGVVHGLSRDAQMVCGFSWRDAMEWAVDAWRMGRVQNHPFGNPEGVLKGEQLGV